MSAGAQSTGPLRIVYLIDKMGAGGAQTHLRGLVAGLDPQRFAPEVICLVRGGVSAERLLDDGFPVRILGLKRLYAPRALGRVASLGASLRRKRAQIVHTYLSAANVLGAFVSQLAGIPTLVTTRRDNGFADGWLMRFALRWTGQWSQSVVAVSEDAARVAVDRDRLPPSRLRVIPNGVQLQRFSPRGRRAEMRRLLALPEDAPLLVSVSHLTRVKGIDVLVAAAARMRAERPDVRVVVAGRGAERASIESAIQKAGLGSTFLLLGSFDDVPGLLEASDLFVLPSRSEGQPNAVIEAMAMGLPVVATRVGGVPEVVRDDEEAVLVPAENPEALARACLDLLRDEPRARRLGSAAQQRATAQFGLDRMIKKYEELYGELVGAYSGAL